MRDVWNLGFFRRFARIPDASAATEAAADDAAREDQGYGPELLSLRERIRNSVSKINVRRQRGSYNAR